MITALTKEEVLELIPQSHPFRFIDEIVETFDIRVYKTLLFKEFLQKNFCAIIH